MSDIPRLFDQLVGSGDQRLRYFNPESLRRLQIDKKVKLGRLLDREITGIGATQDFLEQPRHVFECFRRISRIVEQRACLRKTYAKVSKGWHPLRQCPRDDWLRQRLKAVVGQHKESAGVLSRHFSIGRIELGR